MDKIIRQIFSGTRIQTDRGPFQWVIEMEIIRFENVHKACDQEYGGKNTRYSQEFTEAQSKDYPRCSYGCGITE